MNLKAFCIFAFFGWALFFATAVKLIEARRTISTNSNKEVVLQLFDRKEKKNVAQWNFNLLNLEEINGWDYEIMRYKMTVTVYDLK